MKIAEGAFGKVYKGYYIDPKEKKKVNVAIKKVNMKDQESDPENTVKKSINREKIIAENVQHPNIVKYLDHFQEGMAYFFIMELCEGSLEEIISKRGFLSEEEASNYFRQILEGYKILQEHSILHRDLKPSNILYNVGENNELNIKIADFGLSRFVLDPNKSQTLSIVGTHLYAAPELFSSSKKYSSKADI